MGARGGGEWLRPLSCQWGGQKGLRSEVWKRRLLILELVDFQADFANLLFERGEFFWVIQLPPGVGGELFEFLQFGAECLNALLRFFVHEQTPSGIGLLGSGGEGWSARCH